MYAIRYVLPLVLLLGVAFAGQAQRSTDQEIVLPDESVLLDALQRSNPDDLEEQRETLETLRQLAELSRAKAIKFPETYRELVRFIGVRKPDDENYTGSLAVPTHLDYYPAMLALWYGGEDVLPLITDVLVAEPVESKKYSLAVWEIISISNKVISKPSTHI